MRLVAIVLAALVVPCAGRAQRVESVFDAGGLSVRHADSVTSTAAFVASTLTMHAGAYRVGGRAAITQFTAGTWYAQGSVFASGFVVQRGAFLPEVSASYTGGTFRGGGSTGDARAAARLHLLSRQAGLWIGAAGGRSWNSTTSHPLLIGDAGVWYRVRSFNAVLTANPARVGDDTRYVDTQLFANVAVRAAQLGVGAGTRSGDRFPGLADNRLWWNTSLSIDLSRRISLVASAGTYPVDFTQGFPGGRYATLALRFPARGSRDEVNAPPVASAQAWENPAAAYGITAFEARVEGQDSSGRRQVQLRVRSLSSNAPEIAADFTAWQPLAMVPAADQWWTVTVWVTPGRYEMNVRSGGEWMVPPGLASIRDEFGGSAGILVIEARE